VIRHYDAAERMLRFFVQRAHGRSLLTRPRLVINTPAHLTGVEQRAVRDAAYAAGARQVFLVPSAIAAAIGADVAIHETRGHFVLSIGAGSTEVAVIALGGVVAGESLRLGGDDFDTAVVDYLVEHFDIRVGPITAERIKIELGSAVPVDGLESLPVRGQDTRTGLPKEIELSPTHVRKGHAGPVGQPAWAPCGGCWTPRVRRSPATWSGRAWWSRGVRPCFGGCPSGSSMIWGCRCGWPPSRT
jgi:rod shape-determining protein MreB